MRNLHLYVPNKDTYQSVVLKDEEIFNTIGKNNYWWATKLGGYGFGE